MNKQKLAVWAIVLMLAGRAAAQTTGVSFIPSYHLTITTGKTTNLVFPYSITSVDRGSKDILAQKVKGAENVLELKADKAGFAETNVSVITSDGKLFSFIVDYAAEPAQLNIAFTKGAVGPVQVGNNMQVLKETADAISTRHERLFGLHDTHDKMHVLLKGLYVQNDVFYFQLQLYNASNVSYDIDAVHFAVKDRKKPKRTAIQETGLQPLYATGSQQTIGANTKLVMVIALPKFTLPDGKYLSIHVIEKNGGRDLNLRVKDRELVRASEIK